MTLAYIESEDRVVDVDAMLGGAKARSPVSLQEGRRVAEAICQAVAARGEPEMTMEEIDEEIAKCRKERRERQARASLKEQAEDFSLVLA